MSDITAPQIALWQFLEREARRVLAAYCFDEVRTPILERVDLFHRSLGPLRSHPTGVRHPATRLQLLQILLKIDWNISLYLVVCFCI